MKEWTDIEQTIAYLRTELSKHSSEATRKSAQRFFKHPVNLYGVKAAHVHTIAKETYKGLRKPDRASIIEACEQLWKSNRLEEGLIASLWAYQARKLMVPEDINLFETWIENYIHDWSVCDTFGNKAVGDLLMRYPDQLPRLKQWAISDNLWLRRSAAISLIVPARKGLYFHESIEICEQLLDDQEDLVQKGYGWLLKVHASHFEDEVFHWIMDRKHSMPRTSLRYAIEKMPEYRRQQAMAR